MQVLDPAHYNFSLYALPNLITSAAILILGLIAIIRDRASTVTISFFLVTLTVAIWLFGFFVVYSATDKSVAVWWIRTLHLGVTFIPCAVYQFTVATLRIYQRHKKCVWAGWTISALFFLSVVTTDALVEGATRYWWGFYTNYRWLSIPFLTYFFGLLLASLRHYWVEYRNAQPGTHKLRCKSLMIAFAVSYLGAVDYLAAYGVPLYPFGYLPVLGFIGLTAWAIWRYRLVDITPAFAAKEIINAMADALLVLDHDGVVRVVNQAACQLFGRTERELIGAAITSLSRLLPTNEPLHISILTGKARDHELTQASAPNGIAALSVSSFTMRDFNEEPIAIVSILRDTTRRKQAEEEIQRHLEQTKRQAVELEKANRVKDDFLGVMSHELRTPLNVIIGYADMMRQGSLGEVTTGQERALRRLSARSMELLNMVNGILYATSLEANRIKVESHVVDLKEFLLQLKADYEAPSSKGLTLNWDFSSDLPSLRTDGGKLKHILQNLINNAIKFTEKGHVTVSARLVENERHGALEAPSSDPAVSETGERAIESWVEFKVADTGIGIPKEMFPSIFEKFRQIDSTQTRSYGGVGLGLYIVKRFTEILGGRIEVHSEVGKGSSFTLLLPLNPADAP